MKKRMLLALSLIALLFCLSSLCSAIEYKADTVNTMGGVTMRGKIFVKDELIRTEQKMGQMDNISIVRTDKKVFWTLFPKERSYMERKIDPRMINQLKVKDHSMANAIKRFEKQGKVKKLGKELVNGQLCNKMKMIPNDKTKGTSTIWYSPTLKTAVKTQIEGTKSNFKMELKNIKIGSVAQSLFEIPKGYKKTTMPAGMGGMKGRGMGMPK